MEITRTALLAYSADKIYYFWGWKSLKHKFGSHDNSTKAINHRDDDESLFYFFAT